MEGQRRRLPPLGSIRVFECAARHLSFTRAADELCVTQAAVSHQIKALEEWLGISLFKRLNRCIKLTEAGARYAGPLTIAFDGMADATNSLLTQREPSTLTVGMLESFASIWVLPRLAAFRKQYPELDVRFITMGPDTNALANGDVDMEIRYGKGDWPGLHVKEILREDIFPVCSSKLAKGMRPLRKLSDLKDHDLLHDVISIDWKSWLDHFGVEDVDPERGFGFNHSHLVIQACIEGTGIALGREALVTEAIRTGQLVRPFKESLPSDHAYYIVCREEDSDLPHIKAFAFWLIEGTRDFLASATARVKAAS